MHLHATRPSLLLPLMATGALVAALAILPDRTQAQASKGRQTAAVTQSKDDDADDHPIKGGQAIVALVNDEPITGYELEQRAALLAAQGGGGENLRSKLEARWAVIIRDPRTNERFQQLLAEKKVKTKEEAVALQKQFIANLQRNLMEQVQHESRAGRMPQLRKQARDELIEERVKVQEAKRLGIEVNDDEAKQVLKAIAARNKMTEEEFAEHVKKQGIDIATMRERFRAQSAWREVIRRRFSAQIAITQGEVDRLIATENGEDAVELQVAKIILPLPSGVDQALMARRFADAEGLRRNFVGCKSLQGLARDAADARFEDVKYIKPSSVAEPERSLLLSARDGELLPPATTAAGIELFAVCGRRAIKTDDKQREKVQNELAQHEFEIMAKRHLRDLMQDAHIEYR